MKYIPNFLGTSRGGATSGDVSWFPEGLTRDGVTGRSRQSRVVDKSAEAQYMGMKILKTSRYDVESSSQEAIVSNEMDRSRSESDFGSQDGVKVKGLSNRVDL